MRSTASRWAADTAAAAAAAAADIVTASPVGVAEDERRYTAAAGDARIRTRTRAAPTPANGGHRSGPGQFAVDA